MTSHSETNPTGFAKTYQSIPEMDWIREDSPRISNNIKCRYVVMWIMRMLFVGVVIRSIYKITEQASDSTHPWIVYIICILGIAAILTHEVLTLLDSFR